jgi:hypothetical protein
MSDSTKSCDSKVRWPQPGELWSLWDMLNVISPKTLTTVGEIIAELEGFYITEPYYPRTKDQIETASKHFQFLAIFALEFGSQIVGKSLTKLSADPPQDPALFFFAIEQFTDHLKSQKVFYTSEDVAEYYDQVEAFGEDVSRAFPSSTLEIWDAGNCLALDQNTAAVCHLMRALEPALVAFGREFGVDFKDHWNSALDKIETAVRDRENNKTRPNWDDEKDFYIDAVTHFFHIKNAWRNYSMHLRLRYDRDRALEVYSDTKRFMQKLATKLSE